jgi:MerR family transcriptional regulator, redox-sensitive transcriptional activator SoxR
MTQTSSLSIGQIAARAGVAASTLRYYEQLGLIEAPSRQSQQRRYDPSVLRRVYYIQVAQRAGFTLEEIKTLIFGFPDDVTPGARWQQLAQNKLPEIESLISRALEMKNALELGLRCGCDSLEACETKLASEGGC